MKNTKQLAFWTFAWTLSMVLITFGPEFIWADQTSLTVIGILLNFGIGVKMILANRNLINSLDELQKKIQLESLGLTLGLTVIFGLSFSLLDQKDIIPMDAVISVLVIFIGLVYWLALLINNRKYK